MGRSVVGGVAGAGGGIGHVRVLHLGERARSGRVADGHAQAGVRGEGVQRGRGLLHADNTVWFTTKGDNRVWQLNVADNTYELAYDDNLVNPGPAPLTGVDNITGSSFGDLYVAEDGGNMEICVITPDDKISTFLRLNGHGSSEITGPAFNPAGTHLYFSSQRGTSGSSSGGVTYRVTGPFRR